MRARLVGFVCAVLAFSGLAGVSGTVAAESDSTVLPLQAFYAIVADPVHSHEFISDGATGTVVVADTDGAVVRTLTGFTQASGLTLSSDSSTLYVADTSGHAIDAVNTTDFSRRTFALPDDACPRQVALSDGLLWYTQDCSTSEPSLNAVDPSTGTIYQDLLSISQFESLAAEPAGRPPALFLSGASGLTRLAVVAGPTPSATVVASNPADVGETFAVTPDGDRIVTSYGDVLDSTTLRSLDSYPDADGGGVAIRGDGAVVLGVNDVSSPRLVGYPSEQTVLPVVTNVPLDANADGDVPYAGMVFGMSMLFVIRTGSAPGSSLRLFAMDESLTPDVPIGSHILPLSHFGQVVSDPRHDQAFADAGELGNGVAVLDRRGRVTRVLQHLPKPTEMALSTNGRRLYVALEGTDAIAAISTTTYAVRLLPTGTSTCPSSVAPAVGLIWFQTSCRNDVDRSESVDALDPATGKVHALVRGLLARDLRTSVAHPRELYAGVSDATDLRLRISVTGGAHPTARAVWGRVFTGRAIIDSAMSPDGLTVATVDDYGRTDYSTRSFSPSSTDALRAGGSTSVAVRGDGLTASAGESTPDRGPNIFLSRSPLMPVTRHLKTSLGYVLPSGLALGTRRLWVVEQSTHGAGAFKVQAIAMPSVHRLTAAVDSTLRPAGARFTVAAHVDRNGSAARRPVVAYGQSVGGHRVLVARGRTDRHGNFFVHRRAQVITRFTFVTPRSKGRRAMTAHVTAAPGVRFHDRLSDAAHLTTSRTLMRMGSRPRLTTRVTPGHAGQCVRFRVWQGPGDLQLEPATVSHCVRLDARSRASYVVPANLSAGSVEIRAEWGGDGRNAPIVGGWHLVDFPCTQPGLTPPSCD